MKNEDETVFYPVTGKRRIHLVKGINGQPLKLIKIPVCGATIGENSDNDPNIVCKGCSSKIMKSLTKIKNGL